MRRAVIVLLLSMLAVLGVVDPAGATPTPYPTLVYTPPPTVTMQYTPDSTPAPYVITDTEAYSLGLELDASLWDYSTFEGFKRSARTWIDIADQYHVIDLIFGFAIGAVILSALVRFISIRGQHGD